MWVADTYNSKIKRIDPDSGEVTTLAGGQGWRDGPDPLFYEIAPWSARTRQERIRALSKISMRVDDACPDPGDRIFLMTARSLMTRTISPEEFNRWRKELRIGAHISLDELAYTLVQAGYEHSNLVTEPGDFSRRGGILDIWPPSEMTPIPCFNSRGVSSPCVRRTPALGAGRSNWLIPAIRRYWPTGGSTRASGCWPCTT